MDLFSGIVFTILLPVLGFRFLPLFVFPWKKSVGGRTLAERVSIWEEVTLLIFHTLTFYYACSELVTWEFFWGNVFADDVRELDGSDYHLIAGPYLICYMVFYGTLALLVYFPPVKRDAREMLGHHIATVVLMYLAYTCRFSRISVWVLFINDICDLLLGVSTLCYKMRYRMEIPCFAGFMAAHVFLRVLLYPYKVYQSTTSAWEAFKSPIQFLALSATLPLMLLNFYWLYKCLRICYNRLYLKQTFVDFRDKEQRELSTESTTTSTQSTPKQIPMALQNFLTSNDVDEKGWIKLPSSPVRLKRKRAI